MLLQIKLDESEEKLLKDVAILNQRTPTWTAKKIILDGLKNKGFKEQFVYESQESKPVVKSIKIDDKLIITESFEEIQNQVFELDELKREEYNLNGDSEKYKELQKKYNDLIKKRQNIKQ